MKTIQSPIKWTGSKKSMFAKIYSHFPNEIDEYYEPFCGGGSVFLNLMNNNAKIKKYFISDLNSELVGVWNIIKNNPNELISTYKNHWTEFNKSDTAHRKNYYNDVRKNFNINKNPSDFYFLTRTSINGLIRYNKSNIFNSPCHFTRPGMAPSLVEKSILLAHNLLKNNDVSFTTCGYDELEYKKDGSLYYFDPPYVSLNNNSIYYSSFNHDSFFNFINSREINMILSMGEDNIKEVLQKINHTRIYEYDSNHKSGFRKFLDDDEVSKDYVIIKFDCLAKMVNDVKSERS